LIELAHAYLAAHSPPMSQSSQNEIFQPALVHRLDRETSGVLVIAKSGAALRSLTAALRAGQLHKAYLALIHGHPPEKSGTLRDSLARIDSRTGGAKAIVDEEEGRESISHYTVVETLGKFTLVRVIIETGRMHQIRAHFTHAGLPLAGDRRYGNPDSAKTMREQFGLKRIFLHAESLELTDLSGKGRKFKAPLPPALEAVLTQVRQHQSEKKTD